MAHPLPGLQCCAEFKLCTRVCGNCTECACLSKKKQLIFHCLVPFALSPTHGFDQGLILGSFVANATKENRLIYCNSLFWLWNGKKLWCPENLEDILPQLGKRGTKAKASVPFSYKTLFFHLCCVPSLFCHGSALFHILLSSFLPHIHPLGIYDFKGQLAKVFHSFCINSQCISCFYACCLSLCRKMIQTLEEQQLMVPLVFRQASSFL